MQSIAAPWSIGVANVVYKPTDAIKQQKLNAINYKHETRALYI